MTDNSFTNLTIDLDRTAHEYAAKFAAGHTSIAKGKQVYLNTLAVCAVRQYLSYVCQLDLDLTLGDSWQIELQSIMNVADLVIPNIGKLECLPVLPTTREIEIPPATIDERVGYLFVRISEDLTSAELLGFIDRAESEIVDLNTVRLQPLANLLDIIYNTRIEKLRDFLDGIFTNGWEPIVKAIEVPDGAFALRTTSDANYDSIRNFTASKTINLRAKISNIPLLLMIGLSEEPDGRVKVRVRLHAAGGVTVLPAHLQLILQSEHGGLLSEIHYPEPMHFIQLQPFKLQPGTQFKIRVTFDQSSFTESFVA
jgi:hypothetical protein